MQIEGTRQRIVWKPTLQIRYLLVMWCISFDLIFVQFSWFAFSSHSSVQVERKKKRRKIQTNRKIAESEEKCESNHVMNWIYFSMIIWWFWRKTYSLCRFLSIFRVNAGYVWDEDTDICFIVIRGNFLKMHRKSIVNYRIHDADDGRDGMNAGKMSTARSEIQYRFGENTINMHINRLLDLRTIKCNHIIAHSMCCGVETRLYVCLLPFQLSHKCHSIV